MTAKDIDEIMIKTYFLLLSGLLFIIDEALSKACGIYIKVECERRNKQISWWRLGGDAGVWIRIVQADMFLFV